MFVNRKFTLARYLETAQCSAFLDRLFLNAVPRVQTYSPGNAQKCVDPKVERAQHYAVSRHRASVNPPLQLLLQFNVPHCCVFCD